MRKVAMLKKVIFIYLFAFFVFLHAGRFSAGQEDRTPISHPEHLAEMEELLQNLQADEEIPADLTDEGANSNEGLFEFDIKIEEGAAAEASEERESDLDEQIIIDVLELKDMDIMDVLKLISKKSSLNIIAGKDVKGKVSIFLKNVKLKDALTIILDSNNLAYRLEEGIVRVMSAMEFERRYGYKFGGRVETKMVHLVFSGADEVVSLLNQIKSKNGKIIADAKTNTLVLVDVKNVLDVMTDLIKKVDVPVQTEVFTLSYARAETIEEKIRDVLTEKVGRIKMDKRSNKIAITDTRLKIGEIRKLIEAFDVKQQQVLIEAKIVQIILSDQHKFGVDWEAIVAEYHNLNFKSNFDILNSTDKSGNLSIGTLDSDNYTVLIEALESVGMTNILSSPSITALNNEEAKILVGSTEPYVTTTTTTPASGPTTTAESINFIEVGVKLYVTPTIHEDDFITLKIKPEVSSVTRTITTSNNNVIPVVETSEAETTVMVKDGVTIVIGGLIKEERIDSENKIPLLGDIPLLGYAFRNEDFFMRKTEIVIFLTPQIISGSVPAQRDAD